jgi:hypothetical protein
MALWIPGPWGAMNGQPLKPQPESPHQAAIAEPVVQKDEAKPRRRKSVADD